MLMEVCTLQRKAMMRKGRQLSSYQVASAAKMS